MNLTRCMNGHFYDSEKWPECPHCLAEKGEDIGSFSSPPVDLISSTTDWQPPKVENDYTPPVYEPPYIPPIQPVDLSNIDTHTDDFGVSFLSNSSLFGEPCLVDEEDTYTTKVVSVKAYPAGASITRRMAFTPKEKESVIYITDIPSAQISKVHIRVSKGLTCFSQSHVQWVLKEVADRIHEKQERMDEEKKEFNKKNQEARNNAQYLQDKFTFWEKTRKYLLRKMKKQVEDVDIEKMNEKYLQIIDKQDELRKKLVNCIDELKEFDNRQMTDFQVESLDSHVKDALKLVLVAEPGQTYYLEFEYDSMEATWRPSYEIRMESGEKTAEVSLYADIKNIGSETWEDIDLSLSTGISVPFNPYILDELKSVHIEKEPKKKDIPFMAAMPSPDDDGETTMMFDLEPPLPRSADLGEQTINPPSLAQEPEIEDVGITHSPEPIAIKEKATDIRHEYQLSNKITLTKGISEKVMIWKQNININPYYFAIPEQDASQYLAIHLTDLEQYDILNCEAAVYLDGEFSRNLFLEQGELDKRVVLGRAKGANIVRKTITNDKVTKKIQGKVLHVSHFQFIVKNETKDEIKLQIYDRVPISSEPNVSIEIQNSSDANINHETGICTWDITLPGEQTKTLDLSYIISYPTKEKYNIVD